MCQFVDNFFFFPKTFFFFFSSQVFQIPPVKWDHSKHCILNHQAGHAGTVPGSEQQQEPEPLRVLSRTFFLLLIALPQVLSCSGSLFPLRSHFVECPDPPWSKIWQNKIRFIHFRPQFTHGTHEQWCFCETLLSSFLFHLSCPAYLPFLSLEKTS